MIQNSYTGNMLSAIENELQRIVARLDKSGTKSFHDMLTYHMGWSGEGAGPEATGKRIRPLLVLLSCAAHGKDWQCALPTAACLELIHDFSLVHDDIQDGSELRRGRLTVWKKWGIAQAINVGDALFILAHLVLQETKTDLQKDSILQVWGIINEACLALSSGQFLDIDYEKRGDLSIDDYWQMVSGKTATLLSACTQVGAILGGADKKIQEKYRSFGYYLGLAFQVQDDYLGIWGDSALTGKSTESDLVAGKKTLPVIFGLTKKGSFALRWAEGPILAGEKVQLSEQLTEEGAQSFTQEAVSQMTHLALESLRAANPRGMAGDVLFDLTNTLLSRKA